MIKNEAFDEAKEEVAEIMTFEIGYKRSALFMIWTCLI